MPPSVQRQRAWNTLARRRDGHFAAPLLPATMGDHPYVHMTAGCRWRSLDPSPLHRETWARPMTTGRKPFSAGVPTGV